MKGWVVITIAVICINSVCFAQSKAIKKQAAEVKKVQQAEKSASVKQQAAEVPIKFSTGMLEGNIFNPRYLGLPIDEVIKTVEIVTNVTKGEFESTADFNARKAAALSEKFLGDLSLNDAFAFVVPVTKGGAYSDGLGYTFDADAGEARLFALAKNSDLNGIGGPRYSRPKSLFDRPKIDHFDLKYVGNS